MPAALRHDGPESPGGLPANLLLALGSLFFVVLVGECGLRLASGRPLEAPRTYDDLVLELLGYPATHDDRLGYVPTPGAMATSALWHTRVNMTPEGVRSNGVHRRPTGSTILTVGDSFTFGDEVNDNETWPSHLERRLDRPVINGGVFGYGLDQMVLRAEELLERFPAEVLITSIIGDSVNRCEFSYRYAWKPYFTVDDGQLQLHNVPVPDPQTTLVPPGLLNRAIASSHLALWVARRVDNDRWLMPKSIRIGENGPQVARALVERLTRITRERGVELLLVLQWYPRDDSRPARAALQRARQLGVPVLRVFPELEKRVRKSRNGDAEWGHFFTTSGHMNATGNAQIADIIAAELERLGWTGTGDRGGSAAPASLSPSSPPAASRSRGSASARAAW